MSNNNIIEGKDCSMKQLELRAYTRQEIADVLGVNIEDTKHFKRNIETKLTRWGYSYEYSRKAVTIIKAPTAAIERLSEIMIRAYDMDIRIEAFSFSAFLYSLVVFPEFTSMPWEERANFLEAEFGISVSERTLRAWCSRFIQTGILIKDDSYKTRWITGYCDGEKYRELVDGDKKLEEYADKYWKRKKELLEQYNELETKEKWELVGKTLWSEFHCYVYCCKGLNFSAWDSKISNQTLREVVELVTDIAEMEPIDTTVVVNQTLVSSPIKKAADGEFKF